MINAVQAERKIIFKQLQKGSIDKELANKSETFHVGVSVSLYTEIPDLNFEKNLIALGIDSGVSDGKVLTANIASLEFLDVSYNYIKDLTGIQDFIKLVELRCFNNQLATLDVSRNLALTTLHCSKNQLKTLDVSKNIALAYLHCSRNKLARLDVSKNVALAYLF
jgi:Leucine-rich repeat (LRR) protein